MQSNNPLVSIIIITYNSSKFVCDTLDSAIAQTYNNIEIIISDDCSTDDTVAVCEKWISKHQTCSTTITLLQASKNTGTSGNCNRGLQVSKGEWIKVIAGDDILIETAIADYVEYVLSHPGIMHVVAYLKSFSNVLNDSDTYSPMTISTYFYRNEMDWKKQYKAIKKRFFGSGPTYFCNAKVLKSVGGYDERFPLQEDYPLFIKIIGRGHKMALLKKYTVLYRIHDDSVSHSHNQDSILPKNRVRMVIDYKFEYQREVLGPIWRLFLKYSLWIQRLIIKNGNSKSSFICRLFKLLYSTTDPFVVYSKYIDFLETRFK